MRQSILVFGLLCSCSSASLVVPPRPAIAIHGTRSGDGRPQGALYRDELEHAVQIGLGHFLRHIDLRPVTRMDDAGRPVFVGFEVLAMRPAAEWLAFDISPGDIVTRIDGASVEHYDSVIPVFEGLAAKDKFEISIVRSGAPKTVVIRILSRPAGARPKQAVPSTPAPTVPAKAAAPTVPAKAPSDANGQGPSKPRPK